MIRAIVPSKDRAAQLDLLLRSMNKFCPGVFEVVVLQKWSSYDYQNGYKQVHRRCANGVYGNHISFVDETNFADDIKRLVDEANSECVGLFTDDSVFYRKFHLEDSSLAKLLDDSSVYSFSTRLGQNLIYQKHWEPKELIKHPKKFDAKMKDGQTVHIWRATEVGEHDDFGRPNSPDGNIHTRETLQHLLYGHKWNTLRDLDIIQPRDFNTLCACFHESVLVNIPSNVVHEGAAENWGKYHPKSQEQLNKDFLQGNIIDLDNLFTEKVVSAHQEFPLSYTLPDKNEPESLTLNNSNIWTKEKENYYKLNKEMNNEDSVQDTTTPKESA